MLSEMLSRVRRNPLKIFRLLTPDGVRFLISIWRGRQKMRYVAAENARRAAEFQTEAWRHSEGFSQRTTLGSYEEHVARQASKLDRMLADGTARRKPETAAMFRRRFELVTLAPDSMVLCLAARLGDEVDAWRQLGHPKAIGIDLNPGPDNPFVVVGDYHALQYADASVDCIYCNSLDHAYDIDKIAVEMRRVLKPKGILVLDIVYGYSESKDNAYRVGPLDTTHWPTARAFAEVMARKTGFALLSEKDLAAVGSAQWVQFVMQASAA